MAKRGMLYIYTGNGKGKTTAALGTAFRALGYGWKVLMVQFVKVGHKMGEYKTAEELKNFKILSIGDGFYKIMGDRKPEAAHRDTALKAWEKGKEEVGGGRWDLIIFDELNNAIDYGFLNVNDVVEVFKNRPEGLNIVVTGRSAHEKLIELADLVTEMREIKHPYKKGIKARRGLDY